MLSTTELGFEKPCLFLLLAYLYLKQLLKYNMIAENFKHKQVVLRFGIYFI